MINLLPQDKTPPELASFPWSSYPDSIVLDQQAGAPTSKTVCLMDGAAPELVLDLIQKRGQGHIVQKNALGLATEVAYAADLLMDPNAFFVKPVETVFNRVTTPLQLKGEVTVRSSSDKAAILQGFEAFAKPWPIKPQILTSAITVLDEMVTNACYNAPFVNQKKVVSRTLRIDLKKEEYARAFWGASIEKIMIGCIDPFGALHVPSILVRLAKSFQAGLDSAINRGVGGAGIGFRMIYDYAASVTIAVQPGKHTGVVACFPLNVTPKNAQIERKNLHVYWGGK